MTDTFKRVFERSLLGRKLQRWIGMLKRTTAADAEVRATGCDTRSAGAIDSNDAGDIERRLGFERFDCDLFARQRAFDEHGLAFDPRNAAAFLIE